LPPEVESAEVEGRLGIIPVIPEGLPALAPFLAGPEQEERFVARGQQEREELLFPETLDRGALPVQLVGLLPLGGLLVAAGVAEDEVIHRRGERPDDAAAFLLDELFHPVPILKVTRQDKGLARKARRRPGRRGFRFGGSHSA